MKRAVVVCRIFALARATHPAVPDDINPAEFVTTGDTRKVVLRTGFGQHICTYPNDKAVMDDLVEPARKAAQDLVDPEVDIFCGVCRGQEEEVYFCPKHVDAAGNFTVWNELYKGAGCNETYGHAWGQDRAYYFGEYNRTFVRGDFKGGFEKFGPTECSATQPPQVCRGSTGRGQQECTCDEDCNVETGVSGCCQWEEVVETMEMFFYLWELEDATTILSDERLVV